MLHLRGLESHFGQQSWRAGLAIRSCRVADWPNERSRRGPLVLRQSRNRRERWRTDEGWSGWGQRRGAGFGHLAVGERETLGVGRNSRDSLPELFVTLLAKQAFTPTRATPARSLVTLGQVQPVESGFNRPAAGCLSRPEACSWLVRHRLWRDRGEALGPPDQFVCEFRTIGSHARQPLVIRTAVSLAHFGGAAENKHGSLLAVPEASMSCGSEQTLRRAITRP